MKKKTETERKTEAAFHEVKHDEPAIVEHTRKKFGEKRAEAQKTAIALSKAREMGAHIKKVHHSPTMDEIDCSKLYSSEEL